MMIDCPEPGLYENVDAAAYRKWDAVCHSNLQEIEKSPAHYVASLQEEHKTTPSLILGDQVHRAVLFGMDQFREWEGGDRRKTAVREKYEALALEYGEENLLDSEAFTRISAIRDSVLSHPFVKSLFDRGPKIELSMVWEDSLTKVRCKGRTDIFYPDAAILADLKTSRDLGEEELLRTIFNYKYYTQLSFYRGGLVANKNFVEDALIIGVETEPPYGVKVRRITDEVMRLGAQKISEWLTVYLKASQSGKWPCYAEDILDVGIPAWAIKKLEG